MNPVTAVQSALRNSVNFTGRATRSEYWLFAAATNLLLLLVVLVLQALQPNLRTTETAGQMSTGTLLFLGVVCLIYLALILPSVSLGVRRLHDAGLSGWLSLIVLLPVIGPLILIILALLPSTGDNRWGPAPYAHVIQAGAR
jgi:uncharacterized membrane protein YhaH (DUF805 family)